MRTDDRASTVANRLAEHLARMRQRRRRGPRRRFDALYQSVLPVEAQHPELLDFEVRGQGSQILGDQLGSIQDRLLRSLRPHAARDFQHRRQLLRLRASDSAQSREVRGGPPREILKASCLRQQPRCDHRDRLTAHADIEDEREQFGIAERMHTEPIEPRLRLFADNERELLPAFFRGKQRALHEERRPRHRPARTSCPFVGCAARVVPQGAGRVTPPGFGASRNPDGARQRGRTAQQPAP